MSTATLNVWITEFSDPCHIMGEHPYPDTQPPTTEQWYVHIADCEGKPLVWCGKTYTYMPVKCGHFTVEIPPGCYSVFAGHSANPGRHPPYGNRLTHIQVVRANCGDHVCVTLFTPSIHHCGSWFLWGLESQSTGLGTAIDKTVLATAAKAVRAVVDQLKPNEFDANLQAFQKEPPRQG
jgi:hypothetical protein